MHHQASPAAITAAMAKVAAELVSCTVLVVLPEAAAQEPCDTACSIWAADAGLVPTQGAGLGLGAAPEGAFRGGGLAAGDAGGGLGSAVCGSAHVLSGVVRLRTWVQMPLRTRPGGAASSGPAQQRNDGERTQPREQQEEEQHQRLVLHAAIVMRNVTILCAAAAPVQPGLLSGHPASAMAADVAVPDLHPQSDRGRATDVVSAANTASVVHAVEGESMHTPCSSTDPQPQPQRQPHPRAGRLSGASSILRGVGNGTAAEVGATAKSPPGGVAAAAAAAAAAGLATSEEPGLSGKKAATHGGVPADNGAAVHRARQLTSTLDPAHSTDDAISAAAGGWAGGLTAELQPAGARHAAASRGVRHAAAQSMQAALGAGASLLVMSVALGGCLWWRGLGRRKGPDAAAVTDRPRAGASVGVALGTASGAANAAPASAEAREVGPDGGVNVSIAGGLYEEFSLRPGGAKAFQASAAGWGGDTAGQVQAVGPPGAVVGPFLAHPHPVAHSGPPGDGLLMANTLSTDLGAPSRYGSGLEAPGESSQDGRRPSSQGQGQRAVLHDPLQFEPRLATGWDFPRIMPASDLAHDRCS